MGDTKELEKQLKSLREEVAQKRQTRTDGLLASKADAVPAIRQAPVKGRKHLRGHLAKIYALHWGSDSQHIVSASQDGKLLVWDTYTTNKIRAVSLRSSWVMTCAFAPSQDFVASGGLDNTCSIYNVKSESKIARELQGHTGYLSCCRFLDDKEIITSSGDSTCALWDIENNKRKIEFDGHMADVMYLAIFPSQQTFVSGSVDAEAKIWDIRSGKCVQTFHEHTMDINTVDVFPNGNGFVSGSDDGSCRLFDLRYSGELASFNNNDKTLGVTSVAFSHSGRVLYAAYEDNYFLAFDTLRGDLIETVQAHGMRVSCLGCRPAGWLLQLALGTPH